VTAVPKGKGSVDRSALPRYPDGSAWWPPGLPHDADDATLAAALRGTWATPRWVLDLALDVREMLGGPAVALGFDLDAGTRPGTPSWDLSRVRLTGTEAKADALRQRWSSVANFAARWLGGNDDESRACWPDRPSADVRDRPTVWCNFPFSDPRPWVDHALEAGRDGCWVSVLAPHTTGAWWDDLRANMIAEVPLRRVEFEPCPGLLDAAGKPARGDRPSQQCSLVTLAPAGTPVPAPRVLARDVPRLGAQRFVLLPGPGFG